MISLLASHMLDWKFLEGSPRVISLCSPGTKHGVIYWRRSGDGSGQWTNSRAMTVVQGRHGKGLYYDVKEMWSSPLSWPICSAPTDWQAKGVPPLLLACPQTSLLKHNFPQEWRAWIEFKRSKRLLKGRIKRNSNNAGQGREKNPAWTIPKSPAEKEDSSTFNTIYLSCRKGKTNCLKVGHVKVGVNDEDLTL